MHFCPACRGPLQTWIEVPAGEPGDPSEFRLLRCKDCGTAVTLGDPPGPELYETGIYAPGEPRAPRLIAALQRAVLHQPMAMLRRRVGMGANVLDAGAGTGRLVESLMRQGIAAHGIDPSARSVEMAQAAGRPVVQGDLEHHADRNLDAVVLWHVLEHLDNPRAAIARIRTWVKPGGVVLVAVPNVTSWQQAIAGAKWFHFDAPRHRTHFSAGGLKQLLGSQGLKPVRTGHLIWQHNIHGMWLALLTRLGMTPGFPFHLLKRNVRARPLDVVLLVVGLVLLPVAVVLELLAVVCRQGGTVAIVAEAVADS